jgi:hypothetical protein
LAIFFQGVSRPKFHGVINDYIFSGTPRVLIFVEVGGAMDMSFLLDVVMVQISRDGEYIIQSYNNMSSLSYTNLAPQGPTK